MDINSIRNYYTRNNVNSVYTKDTAVKSSEANFNHDLTIKSSKSAQYILENSNDKEEKKSILNKIHTYLMYDEDITITLEDYHIDLLMLQSDTVIYDSNNNTLAESMKIQSDNGVSNDIKEGQILYM